MAIIQEDLGAAEPAEPRPFAPVEDAIAAIARGEIVLVVDDPGRENEGDFVMAAELVTPETVNFMVTHGRGIVCMPILPDRAATLGLGLMPRRGDYDGCAFTTSIDLADPPNTGTSAIDRARCMARVAQPAATRAEFRQPGHVFPLIAKPGGVVERRGHTEAAVDLARLAGLQPAGVICEVLSADGSMARVDDLAAVARTHGLHLITIADLVAYRLEHEPHVRRLSEARIPTPFGGFTAIAFHSDVDGLDHVALTKGDIEGPGVTVAVHAECLTGDVLGSLACDCGARLEKSMRAIADEGRGAIVYLRGDEAELGCCAGTGSHDAAAQIIRALDIGSVALLNDTATRFALEARGVPIVSCAAGDREVPS
ncbi:MAG: 3,4-dihydroxy-2-butanone-4-phosphate synthase [Actinomycetota bacterium]